VVPSVKFGPPPEVTIYLEELFLFFAQYNFIKKEEQGDGESGI
jgi:hypothetical protein